MKLSGLCLLAVAAAFMVVSEAADCPPNMGDDDIDFLPFEGDCHKYYKCTKAGGKEEKQCGFVKDVQWCYDKSRKLCDMPSAVPCCNGSDTPTEECPCSTVSKCKVYFSDKTVEVCVKKTTDAAPMPGPYF